MKAHHMQLQSVALRFLHKFQMAKFITHIHQHAPVRRLVPMTVTVIMIVVVTVFMVMPAATAKRSGHENNWHPVFHINIAG